ncbi:efflux RND transporter permease subunit, partial [Salmonella enterica]|uniref:efflux RND transporter permease subunit n=1 Tax=Salmonella enterica TaxID=28901 RepID=UPI000A614A07
MNFAVFFIGGPSFAFVRSPWMLLAAAIPLVKLPLGEYPDVTPPTVQVSAGYPGDNAQVVAGTVAEPREQVINGVDVMLYMNIQMAIDGRMVVSIDYEQGTDPE